MTIPLPNIEISRPKDVGILAMEVYFPRRVSSTLLFSGAQSSQFPISVSPNLTLKTLTVYRRANIQSVLGKSTWLGRTIVRTSIPLL